MNQPTQHEQTRFALALTTITQHRNNKQVFQQKAKLRLRQHQTKQSLRRSRPTKTQDAACITTRGKKNDRQQTRQDTSSITAHKTEFQQRTRNKEKQIIRRLVRQQIYDSNSLHEQQNNERQQQTHKPPQQQTKGRTFLFVRKVTNQSKNQTRSAKQKTNQLHYQQLKQRNVDYGAQRQQSRNAFTAFKGQTTTTDNKHGESLRRLWCTNCNTSNNKQQQRSNETQQ